MPFSYAPSMARSRYLAGSPCPGSFFHQLLIPDADQPLAFRRSPQAFDEARERSDWRKRVALPYACARVQLLPAPRRMRVAGEGEAAGPEAIRSGPALKRGGGGKKLSLTMAPQAPKPTRFP